MHRLVAELDDALGRARTSQAPAFIRNGLADQLAWFRDFGELYEARRDDDAVERLRAHLVEAERALRLWRAWSVGLEDATP